jgi:long-chain acyl-CoA synthetase
MSLNLAVLLTESTKKYPNETAIIFDSFKLNYTQLNAVSNQFANGLQNLGIKRGDKVGLMMPNIPQFAIALYGVLKLGAVLVPMNVLLKSDEIEYNIKDSDAVALIAWDGCVGEAQKAIERVPTCQHLIVAQSPGSNIPLPEGAQSFNGLMQSAAPTFEMAPTQPEDTAIILYTSGTTGRPKGAELTHFNLFFVAQFGGDKLMPSNPGDVALAVLPLFHIFGLSNILNTFIGRGAAVTLVPRFDPVKVLEVMQRDKVTHFAGVPTMYFGLLSVPNHKDYDTSSLRVCISGGAAIPVEVLHAFEKEFNVPVLEGYGLSETAPTLTFNIQERPRKPGSIGVPIWGAEMRVVDDNDNPVSQGQIGEIVCRGPMVMKGYYKRPEATAEAMKNDWFHTGDLAYIDEEGYYFIVDRKKDMIIRGGYNVYPREIEEVLYQHPAVREAAVIGVPDPKMGEEVKAFVSLKAGVDATSQELIEFVKSKVAAYKYPREIDILDDLPKGPTGKLLKRDLRTLPQTAKA